MDDSDENITSIFRAEREAEKANILVQTKRRHILEDGSVLLLLLVTILKYVWR
jgi:hypothetical protein